jgi:hypothetical protein
MSSSSLYSSTPGAPTSSANTTGLYGSDGVPVPDSNGNVVIKGTLTVNGCSILTNCSTFNLLPENATTINFGGEATSVVIGAPTGAVRIGNDLNVRGTTININSDATGTPTENQYINFIRGDSTDAYISWNESTNQFELNLGIEVPRITAGNIIIAPDTNDNEITTSTGDLNLYPASKKIGLSRGLTFTYSEANDRLNRPTVQSNSGNTSGWRVAAPNTTTSAVANVGAFNSSDTLNGKFLTLQARGSTTDTLRFITGEYVAGVQQASGDKIAFTDLPNPAHAYVNPAGPTDPLDLTTVEWVEDYVTSGAFIFQKINLDNIAFIDTASATLNAGSSVVLDTWSMNDYGSVKYQIQGNSSGHGTQASEVLVINNSTDAFATEYAVIKSGGNEIYSNLTVDTVGTTVRLLADINYATTYFKAVRTAVKR